MGQVRTALVTGATSGIGLATAAALLARGVRVLVHGRTAARAEAAVSTLRQGYPAASMREVWGDLARIDEVTSLAAAVMEEPRLDILVHNAGLERWERDETPDGFELTLAVNYLAPFLLTRLLTPLLKRSRPARVIWVSSVVHGWATMHWDDLDAHGWYAPEAVYYQSKLAAALAAQEFARRLAPEGICVVLVPPGLTQTAFGRDFRGMANLWSRQIGSRFFRRPEAVAAELASVCLDARFAVVTGAYIDRLRIGLPAARARVREDQLRLWTWTCHRLGLNPLEPTPVEALPPLVLSPPQFGRWLRNVAFGELLGFTLTALVALIGLAIGGRPVTISDRVVALIVMVMAGTLEGASLGWFQWRALRGWLPDLRASRFVAATVAVAAGGWLVGMSMPLMMALRGAAPVASGEGGSTDGPSALAVTTFAIGFGAIAGALFGAVQAVVLAKRARGVRWWIAGSSVGWALGLPIAYVAGSLGTATMSWWEAMGLSVGAGLGMGICVGLTTFAATRAMTPRCA